MRREAIGSHLAARLASPVVGVSRPFSNLLNGPAKMSGPAPSSRNRTGSHLSLTHGCAAIVKLAALLRTSPEMCLTQRRQGAKSGKPSTKGTKGTKKLKLIHKL